MQPWSAARPLALGILTIVFLVAGLGGWASLVTIAGAIIVPGRIEVTQDRQVVQNPDGGVVEAILVSEGEAVAAGDVLLRLDGSALRSEMVIAETRMMELATRRARLEAQRDKLAGVVFPPGVTAAAAHHPEVAEMMAGQADLFARKASAMAQARALRMTRIDQIKTEVAGLRDRAEAVETEISLLEDELSAIGNLSRRGLMPASLLSERQRELAGLTGLRGELAAARASAAGRITETEIEIATLTAQNDEQVEAELRDVVSNQLELAERKRALAARIARLDLVAPASGVVLGLAVTTPGSVIRPAETLLEIVPSDRPALAEVRVPVAHVDEVHPGQQVRLAFPTLPARGTPSITGTVTLVSAAALVDERTGERFFGAEIAIDAQALQDLSGLVIVPGMPVDAFLRTDDRTPLSYLLKPFTDYFRTALRET